MAEPTIDYRFIRDASQTREQAGTYSLVGTRFVFTPFLLAHAGTLDALVMEVSTQAGSAADLLMGIYSRGGDGFPDQLIISNHASPATSGCPPSQSAPRR